MAAAGGRTDPPLDQTLFEAGYSFDFFQAVRLLERLYPHRSPVGRSTSPPSETVRFRSRVAMDFAPSAVHQIARGDNDGDGQANMTVAFMGLTGSAGVLPRHYTQLLIERRRDKDRVLPAFLDLFTHRAVSLFYRAWEKYRFLVGFERAQASGQPYDPFAFLLLDLFGMGTGGLLGRLAVDDRLFLYYAGLLAQRRRSSSGLAGLLSDYFDVPVRVEQFRGQWLPLAERNRTRLGPRGRNNTLGRGALLGHRFWDQQAAFCVRVGPLPLDQYGEFLPSGRAFGPLVQLTRFYAGQQFDFDIQLVLEADEVPRCALGQKSESVPRLGWSSWLKTKPFTNDAGDAVFSSDLTRLGALSD